MGHALILFDLAKVLTKLAAIGLAKLLQKGGAFVRQARGIVSAAVYEFGADGGDSTGNRAAQVLTANAGANAAAKAVNFLMLSM